LIKTKKKLTKLSKKTFSCLHNLIYEYQSPTLGLFRPTLTLQFGFNAILNDALVTAQKRDQELAFELSTFVF
jgi:hypothetical protein